MSSGIFLAFIGSFDSLIDRRKVLQRLKISRIFLLFCQELTIISLYSTPGAPRSTENFLSPFPVSFVFPFCFSSRFNYCVDLRNRELDSRVSKTATALAGVRPSWSSFTRRKASSAIFTLLFPTFCRGAPDGKTQSPFATEIRRSRAPALK